MFRADKWRSVAERPILDDIGYIHRTVYSADMGALQTELMDVSPRITANLFCLCRLSGRFTMEQFHADNF